MSERFFFPLFEVRDRKSDKAPSRSSNVVLDQDSLSALKSIANTAKVGDRISFGAWEKKSKSGLDYLSCSFKIDNYDGGGSKSSRGDSDDVPF